MSTITTGVGLVSGIPIQELVDSLIAVQQRPITILQDRLTELNAQRTAFLQISAQLLSVQNLAAKFSSASFFGRATAVSSNESILVPNVSAGAAPGQYTFTVRSLAAAHQVISNGFATADASPVGAGTLTVENIAAKLDRATPLDLLNGAAGVQRGTIRITDRSGASAEVDLTTALSVQDVVDSINGQSSINVSARIEGDHLVLEDGTGLATGTLTVGEVGAGRTAADLGLVGSSASGVLAGQDLVRISAATRLSVLNDGNGVRRLPSQADFSVSLADGSVLEFDLSERATEATPLSLLNRGGGVPGGTIRITNRAGASGEVDLTGAVTLGDVKAAIDGAGIGVTATISGQRLVITDSTEPPAGQPDPDDEDAEIPSLKIEDVDGGTTAAALGIAGEATSGTLSGKDVYFVESVGDVLRVINSQSDNGGKLTAAVSADGRGLVLVDNTTGAGTFAVTALNDSSAAEDLGLLNTASGNSIESRRLLAGLNTVFLRSLNGGRGVALGEIQLTDRAGATANVDLTGAVTLADVIDALNAAGVGIAASVSANGLGVELRDTSGGTGNLVVSDVSGAAAAELNIAIDAAVSTVNSGNLQKQYVSTATLLSDLNNGLGVARGRFRITDSAGRSAVVDLTQGNEKTLRDVIDEINSRGIGVTARINDHGDGLLLEDTAGGAGRLTIAEDGSTTAKSLGILGMADEGQLFIDGSFEKTVTVSAGDTLTTVLDKINKSGAPVNATIINSGGAQPFRLSLTATQSGRIGELVIDAGTTGISFDTLARARDAVVIFGPADADRPLVVTSATNSLSGVISGVRLDLVSADDQPVTVTISRDDDAIVEDISSFVDAVNAVLSSIDDFTDFNPETEQRGILNGDGTARRVRDRLVALAGRSVAGGGVDRLSQIGITIGSGAVLSFDEQKFRDEFQRDPDAVLAFFTDVETGFGQFVQDEIDLLTDTDSGAIALQEQALLDSEDLLSDRIDALTLLLGRRRERLTAQFNAMESAIASLQSQQAALSSLSLLSLPSLA